MGTIIIKLPEKVIERLREKAREEGFFLVTDYVRSLIYRELGIEHDFEEERILEDIRRLMQGDIPEHVLNKIVERIGGPLKTTGENIDKIVARVERRITDIINPFTSKVDELARRIAELQERIEEIEQALKEKEEAREQAVAIPSREKPAYAFHPRKSAIARLKEQGAVYESELSWLKDADAFFEKLRREGAVILNLGDERIAVDKEFWERFLRKISEITTSNEDEIKIMLRRQEYKLFKKLKEKGFVYFDGSTRKWNILSIST